MRPEFVDMPPGAIPTEPLRRVRKSRNRDPEEKHEAFEDVARQQEEEPEPDRPSPPPTEGSAPASSSGGKSPGKGRRVDLLV